MHYSLLIDVRNEQLPDIHSYCSLTLQVANSITPVLSSVATSGPFFTLLSEFHNLVTPTFHTNTTKHGVDHFIPITGPPVHSWFRHLKPDKLQIAKDEFAKMNLLGIICRSKSPWSSLLHMVPKNSGGWWPCGDYHCLNDSTIPDRYPIPHIQDCSANLANAHVFLKIDLVHSYHQVPVHPADVCKTAVITPFGLFEFIHMPFDLKNTAQAFQCLMDTVCSGLNFLFIYLDDILVASIDIETHLQHLCLLFDQLSQHSLVINVTKCQFGCNEIDFLGHRITHNGILPLPDKVAPITNFPKPSTAKGLQECISTIVSFPLQLPPCSPSTLPLWARRRLLSSLLIWNLH